MVLPGGLALGPAQTWMFAWPLYLTAYLLPLGPVWDAENFLLGVSGRGLSEPLHPLAQQETLQGPLQPVEVGLSFCVLEPLQLRGLALPYC